MGFFFSFPVGLHSTLPGLSQGGPCGRAAVGQRPLPDASHSKSPGQQRPPRSSSSLHLQLQQCLRLKTPERDWKKTPVRTRPHGDTPHLMKILLLCSLDRWRTQQGCGDHTECDLNQNSGRWCGCIANMPTAIIPVVKKEKKKKKMMKGHSVAVGSVEPKDLPICMH